MLGPSVAGPGAGEGLHTLPGCSVMGEERKHSGPGGRPGSLGMGEPAGPASGRQTPPGKPCPRAHGATGAGGSRRLARSGEGKEAGRVHATAMESLTGELTKPWERAGGPRDTPTPRTHSVLLRPRCQSSHFRKSRSRAFCGRFRGSKQGESGRVGREREQESRLGTLAPHPPSPWSPLQGLMPRNTGRSGRAWGPHPYEAPWWGGGLPVPSCKGRTRVLLS